MPIHEQIHVKEFISQHLEGRLRLNATGNSGAHTDFILAAARKRGLTVKKVDPGFYFYENNSVVGAVRNMLTSLVSSTAHTICNNKRLTKEMLEASSVATPKGEAFSAENIDQAREYFESLQVPAVVKPFGGGAGNGVSCGIRTQDHFNSAWDAATAARGTGTGIIVEEYVSGVDIRAYVVGSRVVAAATRLPAFVVGDGVRAISDLVEVKTTERQQNAYLRRMPLTVDEIWLEGSGYTSRSIPPAGEVVTLNSTVNIHQGGEHVDVTDIMCAELKELAVSAAAAIPGLGAAGIDLLVKSPADHEGAVVLEANTKANISVHHLPAYGSAIDVGGSIVDEMLRHHRIREAISM